MCHKYTEEERKFIKNNVVGRSIKELTKLINKEFNLDLKTTQIKSYLGNHNLKNGLDSKFKKGQAPPNKGHKGLAKANKTSFKKGHRPHNYLPVGSERVNGDGYVDIKIADPNKWKAKHKIIWEAVNGDIPKDHVVIFADRNKRNFDINNLILISRKQLLIMNKNKLIQNDSDLTRTGVIIANVYQKIVDRRKK